MENAKRTVNMIRAAFIFAIAIYMFVGERVAVGNTGPANAMLFQILAVVAVVNVVVIVVVRKGMVTTSLAALRTNATDTNALNRWRGGYIVTYALCEAIALYGFVLRIMGFSYGMVIPFYLASFILMIYFSPRSPLTEHQPADVAPIG